MRSNASVVYFDTNLFRRVRKGEINPNDWELMIELTDSLDMKRSYSILNVVEIGGQINSKYPENFHLWQDEFRVLSDCCSENVLPDPQSVLVSCYKSEELSPQTEIINFVNSVLQSTNYHDFVSRQLEDYLYQVREEFKVVWDEEIKNIYNVLVELEYLDPDFSKPQILDETKLKDLLNYLRSDKFKERIMTNLAIRSRVKSESPMDQFDLFSAYFNFYQETIERMVDGGYRPECNVNDHYDLEFLIYLSKGYLFVTEEDKIKRAANTSSQCSQVKKFNEFLTFLQQGGL